MGLHWQYGVVQGGAVATVSAVSDIYSKDDNGTGATGFGNSKFTKTVGGTATHNQVILNPIEATAAGQAITVGLNGNWTGTATSQAWSIIELDNGMGLIGSVSVAVNGSTVATTAAFDPVFTIASGFGHQGKQAIYLIELNVTNSGGTTTKRWDVIFDFP